MKTLISLITWNNVPASDLQVQLQSLLLFLSSGGNTFNFVGLYWDSCLSPIFAPTMEFFSGQVWGWARCQHLPPGLRPPKLHEMQLKGHFPEGPPSNITGRTPSAALVRLSGILIHVTQVTRLRMPGHSEHRQDLLLLSCIHLRRATGSIFNNEKHF